MFLLRRKTISIAVLLAFGLFQAVGPYWHSHASSSCDSHSHCGHGCDADVHSHSHGHDHGVAESSSHSHEPASCETQGFAWNSASDHSDCSICRHYQSAQSLAFQVSALQVDWLVEVLAPESHEAPCASSFRVQARGPPTC